jgi:hypothetical protein
MYLYTQIRPNVELAPEHFTIEGPVPAEVEDIFDTGAGGSADDKLAMAEGSP